ncbi:MAG TPA: class I SAM-dependent methyltransferase [Chthoniobacterales bacterium]|nr:class I SAM-dependent methyltransferase [Chthoniobacterales bacterium]
MSFDAVAPWYRTLETIAFGNALQRARVACLDEIATSRRALVVGEGNGRFLKELLGVNRSIEVDCVDDSEQMLELARRRVREGAGRVAFLRRDLLSWEPPPGRYDLIVTHFFLDCFPRDQLAGIVAKLSKAARPDAAWLLADFCLPDRGFARMRARLWLAAMYRFFRTVAGIDAQELIDPSPFLRSEGFALARQHLFRGGSLKSELWRRSQL